MRPTLFAVKNPVTVFLPGANVPADRAALLEARRQGPVLFLARGEKDLGWGADPGVWTLLAPQYSYLYDTALLNAATLAGGGARAGGARLMQLQERLNDDSGAQTAGQSGQECFAFCAVADTQYVPFFIALVENLRAVHRGPLEIHLLAVDPGEAPIVRAQFPEQHVHIYTLCDLWEGAELERILKRPRNLQALSAKSRLLLHARQKSAAEVLFLLDVDLHFYRSPIHLKTAFGDAHTLVFPQWSDRFTWARLHGILNSGMIGVKKEARPWLEWWSRACWISCDFGEETGRFGDQAFIDQALIYFDGIRVYRGADEDVAAWNRHTLDVVCQNGQLQMRGGVAVGSFHAAGPDDLGLFEEKFAWDQISSVFSVIDDPNEGRALFANTLEQQRRHWPALDRALAIRGLVRGRLGWKVVDVTPDWAKRAVSPWGRQVFQALRRLHDGYGRVRGHRGQSVSEQDAEYAFWVQLQKQVLFQ